MGLRAGKKDTNEVTFLALGGLLFFFITLVIIATDAIGLLLTLAGFSLLYCL